MPHAILISAFSEGREGGSDCVDNLHHDVVQFISTSGPLVPRYGQRRHPGYPPLLD
jgi:hypothetical protein